MTKILCTLGPASLNDHVIQRMTQLGVDLFRLNLSYVLPGYVRETIRYIRSQTDVPICLDSDSRKRRDETMPPLTFRDKFALAVGCDLGVQHVALSFARSAKDVQMIRELSIPGAFVIAKIECAAGLKNCREIAQAADALLVDRGDMAKDVPLERIPLATLRTISTGKAYGVPVYVATDLVGSMVDRPVPTLAEVSDVFNMLVDGAGGMVLAGETAVGRYPVECVEVLKRMIEVVDEDLSVGIECVA